MYRVNLYPEYVEKRRAARQRMGRTALVTVVAALEVIFVAALAITGVLMREQAGRLRSETGRLSRQADRVSGQRPEMDVAVQLLETRQARINWSPKLASLSEKIGPSLRLMQMTAQTEGKGRQAGLELVGVMRTGGADMRSVSVFMDSLRADPRIVADFPIVKLGNIEGGEATRFQVTCGKGKEAS